MPSKASISFNDHDNEVSTVSLRGVDLTAANFNAQVSALLAVRDAMNDVIIGTQYKHSIGNEVVGAKITPSDPFAQRETKWLVVMSDSLGNPLSLEIPCADLAQIAAGDKLDINSGNGLALKAAIEAFHRSNAGNPVTVLEVRHVGRNV